jgi:hypothetical protein
MSVVRNNRKSLRQALLGLNRPKSTSNVQVTYFYDPGSKQSRGGSQKLVEHSRSRVRRSKLQPVLGHELSVFLWLVAAGGLIAWVHWHS